MSLTFDDNHPVQVKYASLEMNAREIQGSFYIVTWNRQPDDGWYAPDWEQLSDAAAMGHEIGGHTCTHSGAEAEVKPCMDSLAAHFPDKTWFTWAYAAGDMSAASRVAEYNIAARAWTDNPGLENNEPANFYAINSVNGWPVPFPDAASSANIRAAFTSHSWIVETIHCVSGPGESCDLALTFTAAQLGQHLDTMLRYEDRLWIAPFGDVVRYIKERRCAEVSVVSSDTNSITLDLTDTLNDEIFDMPITIKLADENGWPGCAAMQAGNEIPSSLKGDTILIDAVPDKGLIAVGNNGSVILAKAAPAVHGISPVRIMHGGKITIDAADEAGIEISAIYPNGRIIHMAAKRMGNLWHINAADYIKASGLYMLWIRIKDNTYRFSMPIFL